MVVFRRPLPIPLGQGPALLFLSLALLHFTKPVSGDGHGLIGFGKWFYKPLCAHACRAVIEGTKVVCSPTLLQPDSNDTTPPTPRLPNSVKRHPHDTSIVDKCFLKDAAFLRTLALCISEHCLREGSRVSAIEEYWEGHIATGVLGDTRLRPIMTYQDALRLARGDVAQVGEIDVPYARPDEPLNTTSLVRDEDWLPRYNARKYLERNEEDHQKNAFSVAVSSVLLPVVLSALRFLPSRPLWYSRLSALLESPLIGRRHRTPIICDLGIMPTRGQALFITYILVVQALLCILPLVYISPNTIAPTLTRHYLIVIGDRTGVVAMANLLPLLLFSSRNNILLWITNWRHSTFLLLHRWIGYCLITQVSAHSLLMFLLHLSHLYDHHTKSRQPPWILGMTATFAFALIYPFSLLPIRKRAYELFLVCHQAFAVVAILATFMHINYLFQYDWGYEIWLYIGGGVWLLDRTLRLARIISNGWRTAVLTAIDDDIEFVRVQVNGVAAEGHVYIYFPTLSWRFWENHPYSVLSSFSGDTRGPRNTPATSGRSTPYSRRASRASLIHPCTQLLIRTMDGFTKALNKTLRSAPNRRLRLPVLIESDYHANPAIRNLSHCSSLLCIAGGVGITAVLPIIKTFGGVRSRLEWGVRSEALVLALQQELAALEGGSKAVEVNTSLGRRLKVPEIVKQELQRSDDMGDLGVVVCGPLAMADDVRMAVSELGPKARRGVVFIDESFSW